MTNILRDGQSRAILSPFIDPQRIYNANHYPVLHDCSVSQNSSTALLYDTPQRRWYQVNVSKPIDDRDWFEEVLFRHLESHREPFNTINIDKTGVVVYSINENVGRPIHGLLRYDRLRIPSVPQSEVHEKSYLYRAVDTCIWRGMKCVYKQIEFSEDITPMEREISTRENLLTRSGLTDVTGLTKHGVLPILAVVVTQNPPLVLGILMPFIGRTFDDLIYHPKTDDPLLTMRHVIAVLRAVKYLHSMYVVHGDISEKNICANSDNCDGLNVQLIDFGEVAPNYEGDIEACARLLSWCVDNFKAVPQNARSKIRNVGHKLRGNKNLEDALRELE
jgi:hypothetical protein